MIRKCIALLFSFALSVLLIVPVSAHPGGTDGNGGHYNRSTGEYHYHHGCSAHQHPNGKCPYDDDDTLSQNSSSYSGSYKGSTSKSTYTVPASTIVYVTEHGEKYHREDCSYITSSVVTSMTISRAVSSGYDPCSRCTPDTKTGSYISPGSSGNSGNGNTYSPSISPKPQTPSTQPNTPTPSKPDAEPSSDLSDTSPGLWVFLSMLLCCGFLYAVSFPTPHKTKPPQEIVPPPKPAPRPPQPAPVTAPPEPPKPTPPPEPPPQPEPPPPPEPEPRPQKRSIPLHSTDSSAISHWGYDVYSQRLFLRMRDSGILYVYLDVPYEVAADLRHTPSIGRYYNTSIKGKYYSRNLGYKAVRDDPPRS